MNDLTFGMEELTEKEMVDINGGITSAEFWALVPTQVSPMELSMVFACSASEWFVTGNGWGPVTQALAEEVTTNGLHP